jgi:4-amino-4-deoxy-L-arabinose transferase-like glycosyltransferase
MLIFGFFCGCAIFVKGPLGLIPVLGAIFFPIVSAEHRKLSYYGDILLAFIVSIALTGWWFVYISMHTDFFNNFFLSQLLDRIGDNSISVTGTSYHQRPVWMYYKYILKYGGFFIPLFIYGIYRLKKDRAFSAGLKYMLLLAAINFIVIHFITTREHRYLYQVYLLAWVAGAYGLKCFINRNGYDKFIKYAGLTFAVFIAIYPYPLHWNSYGVLMDAKELSEKRGVKVVAQPKYINDISDKAAMSYYVPDYVRERPNADEWLEVVYKKEQLDGFELGKTRRVRLYLMKR